jgi:N-methylhydantoinase B
MNKPMRPRDPVELAIFSNLVAAVAEEACSALERTAYTTFVKEANDFAVALADPSGTFFAYPRKSGVTTFIGLPLAEVIASVEDWQPGDVLLTNDPYTTGGLVTHSPDFNLIAPVFFDGELVAFCWGFLHSSDVGGSTPGSIAPSNREIFQEGIRIPPMKLYRAGAFNKELYEIIKANVRIPYQVWGDINALMSSFHVASQRLREIFAKYGIERARDLMDECLRYAEAKARAVIAEIPSGTYRFTDYLDDDIASSLPVRICLSLTVSGSDVHLDFTGTDPQVLAAFNLATAGKPSHAWLTIGLVHYLLTEDPEIPLNGGVLRPLRVTAPAGTLVHAVAPASLGGRIVSGIRVMDVTFGALTQAVPDRVPAAGAGQGMLPVISMPALATGGRKVNILQPLVGGSGGRPAVDGYDGTDYSLGFLKNSPIEVLESEMDVLVHRYHYLTDSGGPGKYRGGLGIGFTFEALLPDTVLSMRGMERTRFAPWGVHGGHCGASTGPAVINRGRPTERHIVKLDVLRLDAGDVVEIVTSGGGGYRDPCERDPGQVARDVRFGFVSRKVAETAYGVVLKRGSHDLDLEKTAAKRGAIKRKTRKRPTFSLGAARDRYDRLWTPGAYAQLQRIYATLPIHARIYAKRAIMERALAAQGRRPRPMTGADIRRAWTAARAKTGLQQGPAPPGRS